MAWAMNSLNEVRELLFSQSISENTSPNFVQVSGQCVTITKRVDELVLTNTKIVHSLCVTDVMYSDVTEDRFSPE